MGTFHLGPLYSGKYLCDGGFPEGLTYCFPTIYLLRDASNILFAYVVSALIFLHGFEFISRYQVNVLPQPGNSSGPSRTYITPLVIEWPFCAWPVSISMLFTHVHVAEL